jgi:chromosome segregation ATPase
MAGQGWGTWIGAIGGLSGVAAGLKLATVDRRAASRADVESIEARYDKAEARSAALRRELDEVRARLDDCYRRDRERADEALELRREINDLRRQLDKFRATGG